MKQTITNNSISVDTFSKIYPAINKYMMEKADSVKSRNGITKEVLNFKTELTNPYRRCVGGCKRDVNIFFLLAEALWIFSGRKDVAFLKQFNAQMAEYSDDGINFHAPYGFRLRHYGVSSFDKPTQEANHHLQGLDQILQALKMLSSNAEDRRVVLSIWNPDLDLNIKSKDLPCNDLLMFKIRNQQLHTTISNRSNDLHWGLPTNIFQFSFISEIISNILDVKLGTQVHNSQSLHIYTDNKIAWKMYEELQYANNQVDLYDHAFALQMDMKFTKDSVEERLIEVDYFVSGIIQRLEQKVTDLDFEAGLKEFSLMFYYTYRLLKLYLIYKEIPNKNDEVRMEQINKVKNIVFKGDKTMYDIKLLACNFFASRMNDYSSLLPLGKF